MADLTLAVELVGRDLSASREIEKVSREVRAFGGAAQTAATEISGFETVLSRRLIPSLGLVGLSAGAVAGAGLLAFGAAAASAIRSGIAMDAQLEQETLRFQSFGLSAQQAQAHVKELFELGAATPFTAQQLIEASRLLRTFGGAALDTRANIVTLGDTAAATGADFNALSFWVGRLYADLQAGKPFGEAEQNLRQLAVLTPEAAADLERLAKAGAPASETFAAFTRSLQGFGGAMEAQSHTLEGLTSTLGDNLSQLAGIAFAPAFEANKAALEGFNAALSSGGAHQTAQDVADISLGIRDMGAAWGGLPASLISWLALGPAGALPGAVGGGLHGAADVVRASRQGPRDAREITSPERTEPLSAGEINAITAQREALEAQGDVIQQSEVFIRSNVIALGHHAAAETADADAAKRLAEGLASVQSGMTEGSGVVGRMTSALRDQADAADQARREALTLVGGWAGINDPANNEFARRRGAGLSPAEMAGQDRILQGYQEARREQERFDKESQRITDANERERLREEEQQRREAERARELAFRQGIGGERLALANEDLRRQIHDLQPAKDKAALENEVLDIERERISTQIDLQQAQHDGDQAAIAALNERIHLYDQEIDRVRQLGIAKAQEANKGGSIFSLYRGALVNDPYHLYGGDPTVPAAAPTAEPFHWPAGWGPNAAPGGPGGGPQIHGDVNVNVTVDGGGDPELIGAAIVKRFRDAAGAAASRAG